MVRTIQARLTAILLVIALVGCAEAPRKAVRHSRPFPTTVAFLPFNNHSNSMVGPVLIRKVLVDMLAASSMEIVDLDETDSVLRTAGINDGGQLPSTTPQKLGKLLDVEALFYGELLEFSYTNVGIISKRAVKARLTLVDAQTGEKLWEAEREEVNSKGGLSADSIKDNFVGGLGTKLLEKAMKSPLRPETESVAHALLRDLARAKQGWN